uniref:Uncharacterized protein n=1 Tax=Strongyloides stercoralis TaxID=6248 RepID=A0A0K0ECP8_STRER
MIYSRHGAIASLNRNIKSKSAKSFNIRVFGEGRCRDTTNFFNNHFAKFVSGFRKDKNFEISYVPFGKASCIKNEDDFNCTCHFGPLECQLNILQNCVIDTFKNNFNVYFPFVHCIQGKGSLDDAISQCLTPLNDKLIKSLKKCSEGKKGRKLLANAEKLTRKYAPQLNFVPWIVINNQREVEVFYTGFEKAICNDFFENSTVPESCFTYIYKETLYSIDSEKIL